MKFSCGLCVASLFLLSLSVGAYSGIIVAPGNAAMPGFPSASVLSGLTLPAIVWIVLAGAAALVYLIRQRH